MSLLTLFLTSQPNTPLDKLGQAGGPLLIILVMVVLPLAALVGLVYFISWLIRRIARAIRCRREERS